MVRIKKIKWRRKSGQNKEKKRQRKSGQKKENKMAEEDEDE